MIFDEIHPRVLTQFELKNDNNLINKKFRISFVEVYDEKDEDFLIYRIENLKPF